MSTTERPIVRILGPGHRQITWHGHTYNVCQFVSDYGDKQWMIDRDDKPCWSQATTLDSARRTIQVHG